MLKAWLEVDALGAKKAAERRDVVIAIDVLRASSTIITALSNGAREVIPTLTLAQARELAHQRRGSILGGERRGMKPRGFDLGNSPREYREEVVCGRTVILTTTSGTKALIKAEGAKAVLTGSLMNGRAAANAGYRIARSKRADISLVASGGRNALSFEDLLCAGQIATHLRNRGVVLDDGCEVVSLAWGEASEDLSRNIWRSGHADYLRSIGLAEDVAFCIRVDTSVVVPEFKSGTILPLRGYGSPQPNTFMIIESHP
jgi:2-phosphosulfolactate phosphatase